LEQWLVFCRRCGAWDWVGLVGAIIVGIIGGIIGALAVLPPGYWHRRRHYRQHYHSLRWRGGFAAVN
jgi:hypothetical protein